MKLVNVGCGRHIHPDWCNLDLQAAVPGVVEHDLRTGLPFAAGSCDAVYHSHVLEHLTRQDGSCMLAECFRVLKPGGVLRVVVPDLERIARDYLAWLGNAADKPEAIARVEWMKIELIDQMVRTRGGGEMISFARSAAGPLESFIRERLGDELFGSQQKAPRVSLMRRLRKLAYQTQRFLALTAVTCLLGNTGRKALKEGLFRNSGEVHRWMYDRVTLKSLLESVGFVEVQTERADSSRIVDFNHFQLDCVAGRVRKPDSLFLEAIKPRAAAQESFAPDRRPELSRFVCFVLIVSADGRQPRLIPRQLFERLP